MRGHTRRRRVKLLPEGVPEFEFAARRYVSRPVEVEAMQWTGDHGGARALRRWMNQEAHQWGLDWSDHGRASLWVKKAGHWVDLALGDYVVAEPDGDGFYPCERAVFEDRYTEIISRAPQEATHAR